MSLRHAVLGLLAYEPATGYELAQQFDTSLAYAWHASHSQIYLERWLLESEPSRAQRSGTAVRWFLMFLLPPEKRRQVLAAELAHADEYAATLREIDRRVRQEGGSPIKPTLDLGLRTSAVMREWLQEQLDALDDAR
jgi:PadR family transcriptional regulator AphA